MTRKFTPEQITTLTDNQIFVFGSNANGNHSGGAAKLAVDYFGAKDGFAEGIQGQSYAIITLDGNMHKIPIGSISEQVDKLIEYAEEHPDKEFLVTKIGCGIAGFGIEEIAPIFKSKLFPINVVLPMEFILIRGYKGFDKNMKCRDFQYSKNSTFETNKPIKVCNRGFHFCEYPLDIFSYYNPADSVFCEVEGEGSVDSRGDDSKISCSKISVKGEISFSAIVDAAVKFTFSRVAKSKRKSNSGDRGAATNRGCCGVASNSGNCGAATNSGDHGAATNSGYYGAATNSGNYGVASNSGNYGVASNSGYYGAATNSGNYGAATNSGYCGVASNSGDRGAATNRGCCGVASNSGYCGVASNSGYRGVATNSGDHGVASGFGYKNKVKGVIGSALFLTERGKDYKIINVYAGIVDGENIKADTWYTLVNGSLTECQVF